MAELMSDLAFKLLGPRNRNRREKASFLRSAAAFLFFRRFGSDGRTYYIPRENKKDSQSGS